MGIIIYTTIFNLAVADYLNTAAWNRRAAWMGTASFDFFNQTVNIQFEGYSDYSYYYVHWGHHFLNGTMPYAPGFGQFEMDGITNNNGAYIFPPLYAILYAFGIFLNPIENTGIGVLLSIFGYITVFPTYGIMYEFTKSRRAAEAAAFTYMLSPLVLYHTLVVWLNTAPVVFFFFSGFYFIIRGKRNIGTLLIVIAALFKQIVWFLGVPLVIYLLLKWRTPDEDDTKETLDIESSHEGKQKPSISEWLFNSPEIIWYLLSITVMSSFVTFVLLFVLAVFPSLATIAAGLQIAMLILAINTFYISVSIWISQRKQQTLEEFQPLLRTTPIIAIITLVIGAFLFSLPNVFVTIQDNVTNALLYSQIALGIFIGWWPFAFVMFLGFNLRPSSLPDLFKTMKIKFDTIPFLKSVIIVLVFVVIICAPFVIANPTNFFRNIMLAAGGFYLDDFVNLPKYGAPMRFQVLPIVLGQSELAAFLNEVVYRGLLLWIGVFFICLFIFLTPKEKEHKMYYLRRILFLSLILMLWVHLVGPRGVYKYYFVIFAPFFSIFSSARMAASKEEVIPFSLSMLYVPFLLSAMIIIPNRTVYLFGVIIIMIGYLISHQMGTLWSYVKRPFGIIKEKMHPLLQPLTERYTRTKERIEIYISY